MRLIDLCFIPYLSGHQTLNCYGLHFTKCVHCLASIKYDFVKKEMNIFIYGKDILPQRSSTTIAYTPNKLHKVINIKDRRNHFESIVR